MENEKEPEMRKMLEEDLALSKDNHRMLQAIRRDRWFALVWKILFWAVLILAPLYLYKLYLQPLVAKLIPGSGTAATSTSGFFEQPFTDLQKLIDSVKVK